MIKYLTFVGLTFIMLFISCSDTTKPADTNDIVAGFNCDVSGPKNFKFSVRTASAALTAINGKTAFSIMATSSSSEAPYQFVITVFGKTKGTYEQTLENADNPQVMCTVIADSSRAYVSITGKVTLTEVDSTLVSNIKGTFNFDLKSGLDKTMKITNGTFNVPFVIL